MKFKFFVGVILFWLILLLTGCGSEYPGVVRKDVPITVSQPNSKEVDVELIIKQVEQRTKARLPNAYFSGLVFWGQCQDLPKRQERIVITYTDISRPSLLTKWELLITASINTVEQKMDYYILDYSEFGLNPVGNPLATNEQFKTVAHLAHQHIMAHLHMPIELNEAECEVVITQLPDVWDVSCYYPNMVQKCLFEIDAQTGEIREDSLSKP